MNELTPGLENLDFTFPGQRPARDFPPVLVGVVGSGNLEVLLEPVPGTDCTVIDRSGCTTCTGLEAS